MRKRSAIVTGLILLVGAIAITWLVAGRRRGPGASEHGAAASTRGAQVASARPALPDPRREAPAELRGHVRTRGGGPIAGAQVCSRWFAKGADTDLRREPACAATDASGAYRLVGLVPATHRVSASAPQHVPASWRAPHKEAAEDDDGDDGAIELAAGEVREGVDLELAPGGVEIKGVVADVSGGAIADARVTLESGGWWRLARATTRTDAQGRFTLWGAPGEARLEAEADGYADGEATAIAPAQAVEILLSPESSLGGLVVEADTRAPVADVLVEVSRDADDPFASFDGITARTGADGRFRLERLRPGRYKPTARGRGVYGEPPDSVLLGLGQRVDDLTIEVHAARIVRGTIEIDLGGARRPCKHGRVSLKATDRDRQEGAGADDDGTVELLAVRPGRYQVAVTCRGHLARDSYEPVVVAGADVTGLVWTVGGGGAIHGVVRTDGGKPVPDLHVMAQTTGGSARGQRSWANATSDDDGGFELEGLAAGEYTLRIWSDEHRAPEPAPTVKVALGEVTRTELVLAASGTIAGQVVDVDGAPVAGASVYVSNGGTFRFGSSARSGEDGRFVVKGVAPGERRVLASRGLGGQLRRPGTTDDDLQGERVKVIAGKTAEVRLVVESQSGVITGTVRDGQGQPIGDAWVVTSRESDAAGAVAGSAARATRWTWDRDERPVITDVAGAFTVRGLSPGSYTVRAFRRGGGEAVAEHVPVGGSATLVIRATGLVAGTVTTADGAIPDELTVSISDAKSGFSRSESFYLTGGRFTMRDLPAGDFVVAVTAGGGRASQDVALAAGAQRTDLRFVLAADVTVRGRLVELDGGAPVAGMATRISPLTGDRSVVFTSEPETDRRHISGDDGRFEIARAPVGKGTLDAFPLMVRDSAFAFVRWPVEVRAGAAVVELGDIPVVRRRVKPGQQAGSLGISIGQQPPDLEPALRELRVSKVRAGGPAEAAGVKAGDVVVAVDGHDVRGVRSSLAYPLMSVPVGTRVALGLARGDTVTVTSGPPP